MSSFIRKTIGSVAQYGPIRLLVMNTHKYNDWFSVDMLTWSLKIRQRWKRFSRNLTT